MVSDGSIRDAAGAAALDMPVFTAKPSAPTNLIRHHAIYTNAPVACGGVAVYPADIMVGDDDGVMVIPRNLADEVATEAPPMKLFEEFVLEEVLCGVAIIGLYPPTDPDPTARFAAWKETRS